MTRIGSPQKAPLFEELEPRLLFSADVAEPVAAEAVQGELLEEPIIIIAETAEHAGNLVDISAETPADSPSSAEDHQSIESMSGSTEFPEDTPQTNPESPLSQSEEALSVDATLETTGITADSASNETDFQITDSSAPASNSHDVTLTAAEASLQPAELILINDNVRDLDQLIAGFVTPEDSPDSIDVIVLDTAQDGIQQVGDILAGYDNLDAIHIFTHGRDGSLALGSDWLTASNLRENSEAVSGWGEALSEDGDILLYGCSIASGEGGHDFVDSLAALTRADVSASDDPTGHDDLGGDWELEYRVGATETSIPLKQETTQRWQQLLAATVADDFSTNSYDGSTGTASWNNDWQEINETDGAGMGNVSIYSHPVFGSQPALSLWKDSVGIWREADLSGATTATLSFDWGFYSVDAGDFVTVEISTDGGTTWNPIDTFSGPGDHSSLLAASYDISSYIDNDTRIKFETTTFGDNDEFILDNVLIDIDGSTVTDSTVALSPIKDSYLDKANDDRNYGDSTSLIVDKSGGEYGDIRSLLQFDLSSIPAGATITSATLELEATANSAAFAINVYEITQNWQEGSGGTGFANWDDRLPSISWGNQGGTVDPAIRATLTTAAIGTHSWDITTLTNEWFSSGTNYGLLLGSPETGDETVIYDSREGASPPQLIITYTAANTAPVLDTSATPTLNSVEQESGPPSGAIGTLIADLVDLQGGGGLDNVTDPDAGALTGIALTDTDMASGSWHYSIDNGSNWLALGTVNDTSARLLAADAQTRIYFEPDPGFSGTIAGAITFRAWDQTAGTNGGLADVANAGGTYAFSTDQDSADISVSSAHALKETVSPIIVDGVVDSFWSLAVSRDISLVSSGGMDDGADLSATWRGMWDASYLYALIEVNDETIVNDSGIFPSDDDFLKLYIDADHSRGMSYDGDNDFNFGFRIGDETMWLGPNGVNDTTGILYDITTGSGSYVAEIAIPWSTLGVVPLAGSNVGMEVKIADDDDGGTSDALIAWHDQADDAWWSPSVFGTMKLVGNSPPSIEGNDTGTVAEDDDPDADDLLELSGTLTISDPDPGESSFIAETITGTYGDLTINGTGNWDYSADNNQVSIQQIDAGQSVTDTLTISAADGTSHDVVITINGAEDDPVIGGIAAGTVTEDGSLTASDMLTITDADTLDNPISFDDVAPAAGSGGYGSFQMSANVWSYTLDNGLAAVQALNGSDSLTDTYTFTATDGSPRLVTITINGSEDTPYLAANNPLTVPEEGSSTIAPPYLAAADNDNGASEIIFTVTELPGGSGFVRLNSSPLGLGETFTQEDIDNNRVTFEFTADASATTFKFTLFDGTITTPEYTFNIVGAPVNDAPVVTLPAAQTVLEEASTAIPGITISDSDAGGADLTTRLEASAGVLHVTLSGGAIISTGANNSGDLTISGTVDDTNATLATLSYTGNTNVVGTAADTLTVSTDDGGNSGSGGALQDVGTVQIDITNVDDAPVIAGTDSGSVTEDVDPDLDTLLEIFSAITITDPDAGESSFAAETITGIYGDLTIDTTGNWSYSADNSQAVIQQLDFGQSLIDTMTVTTADGTTHAIVITINGAEDLPVIGGTAMGTVAEDGALTDSGTLTITDIDSSDNPIAFLDETATPGDNGYGTFEITANTWTYTLDNPLGAVQALDAGESLTDTYLFRATDGSTQRVTVTINGMEDAPVLQTTIPDQNAAEDLPFSYTITPTAFSDPDTSDSLTYTATLDDDSPLPAWLNFNEATRTFSGTPEEADVGAVSIKVTADDGIAAVADIFTITVANTNDTPVAVDDTKETTRNTSVITDNVLGNDTLGDGLTDISSFDATSSLGGSILYNNDGTFTYTPANDFTGVDTFTYTITDADGEMSVATVTVTVNDSAVTVSGPVDPVDPVEPEPDPLEPDPETTDPEDITAETPAEEPVPDSQPTPADEYVETAVSEEPGNDSSEPATVTNDKSSKDPVDNARTAAQAVSVANDPAILISADSDGSVPDNLSAPVKSDIGSASTPESSSIRKIVAASSETTTLLLKRYLDHVNFLSEVDYSTAIEKLGDALDEFREEAESEEHYYKTVIGSAIAVSTGLSVGYVAWLIRGGMLLSSMLFSMPAWQLADPLPLLAGGRDDEDEDEETLETIIKDNAKRQQRNTGEQAKSAEERK